MLVLLYQRKELNTIPEDKKKRKTVTSSAVKARYNAKAYDRIVLNVRKDIAAAYRAKCDASGIPYSKLLHEAIEKFLDE